jgi:hypothetical protein
MWWYRSATEASKDVRVKMELRQVMVYDHAFGREAADKLMDF